MLITGEDLADAAAAGFRGGRFRNAAHQGRVPRGRQSDRLRKHGGAFTRESVKRFLEGNDGNAEPRLLHEVALDCIDAFGVRASCGRPVAFPVEICRPKMPFE